MSAALRAPASHNDVERSNSDTLAKAAAICFQSAGQVVTVLGKLDKCFNDNTELARFTKQAVAEYASKRETQIVSVVVTKNGVTKNAGAHDEDEPTQTVTIGAEHYAITIGDLRDGRTQMDHINRIIERLKYLQAVMVMLSTTDMLGTSQAVGKQMGGLNAKVQQVQKLGVKLEQFSKQVAEAQKENKPLPAEALKPILTQLNRLNTAANPPEIRKIVQAMLTQVKELRDLPIMRQALAQTNAVKAQLHIATKNDAPIKTQTRFKVPLKLVANREPQQLRTIVHSAEPVKVTRHFTVLTPARTEQLHTRMVSAASFNQAGRIEASVSRPANDNRFRIVPQQMAKAIEARHVTAPVQERSALTPAATQRFSAIASAAKQSPVLATLVQIGKVALAPIAVLQKDVIQNHHTQTKNAAMAQPVSKVTQSVQLTGQQTTQQTGQAIHQPRQSFEQTAQQSIQTDPRQSALAEPMQTATAQTANIVSVNTENVVQLAQMQPAGQQLAEPSIPIVQNAPIQQANSPVIETNATPIQTHSNAVTSNPVSETQLPPRQETQPVSEMARTTTHAETQKTHATSEHSTAHLTTTTAPITAPIAETAKRDGVKADIAKTASHHAEVNRIADHIIPPEKKGDADVALRQPVNKLGGIPDRNVADRIGAVDNDNPTQRGPQQPIGAPSTKDEQALFKSPDPITKPQPPIKPEETAKQTPKIVQEFKDCGCGHCAEKGKEPPTAKANAPVTLASPKEAEPTDIKTKIGLAIQETCQGGPDCPLCKPDVPPPARNLNLASRLKTLKN